VTRLRQWASRIDLHGIVLVAIIVFTFARGVLWVGLIPYLQEPDGRAHMTNVQFFLHSPGDYVVKPSTMLASHELLDATSALETYAIQTHPNYKGSVLSIDRWNEVQEAVRDAAREPYSVKAELSSARTYPPAFYAAASLAYRAGGESPHSVFPGSYRVRMLSLVLSTLTVLFAYLAFRELFGRGRTALVGALTIALLPMAAFVGTGINPDVPATMLFSVITWQLARVVRRK
jgi:hypothetical protein